jgi:hypothetical protein
MAKLDLTQYSENELSLLVYNDEWLYNRRRRNNLKDILDDLFVYTPEQLSVLTKDLEEEDLE